jgi:hypothetical protein
MTTSNQPYHRSPVSSSSIGCDVVPFPREILVDANVVKLKRVPLHPGYGVGNDGHLYTFYHPEIEFGYFTYGIAPRRKARMPSVDSRSQSYALERAWDRYECGCLVKGVWDGWPDDEQLCCTLQLNGDADDLRPENLVWCTLSEKLRAGCPGRAGESNASAKLTEEDVLFIRRFSSRISVKRLSAMFGVTGTTLRSIIAGNLWPGVAQEREVAEPLPTTLDGVEMREVPNFPGLCVTADCRVVRFCRSADMHGWDNSSYRELKPWGDPAVVNPSGKRRNVPVVVLGCLAFCGSTSRSNKATWTAAGGFRWQRISFRTGERNGSAKLSEQDVIAIRSQPNASRLKLAAKYGCSVSTIRNIRSGRNWKLSAIAR